MAATLEERLAAVETEVKQLREQLNARGTAVIGRTTSDWLDKIAGSYADDPLFEEAVRHGREWREADRPEDGETDAALSA